MACVLARRVRVQTRKTSELSVCVAPNHSHGVYDSEDEDKDAKARRVVRANNFTQQTNALDVDKHMYFGVGSFFSPSLMCSVTGWHILKRT